MILINMKGKKKKKEKEKGKSMDPSSPLHQQPIEVPNAMPKSTGGHRTVTSSFQRREQRGCPGVYRGNIIVSPFSTETSNFIPPLPPLPSSTLNLPFFSIFGLLPFPFSTLATHSFTFFQRDSRCVQI